MNFLNTNNRQGQTPELKYTINGLGYMNNKIVTTPMIITDFGGTIQNKGPYYIKNRQLNFHNKLRAGKTFFIIFNHFTRNNKLSESLFDEYAYDDVSVS